YNEAEKSFCRVMGKFKRVLAEEHPSVLTSMGNLASTFRNQGRWEAEELSVQMMIFVRVREMETRNRVLREEHPDMLISMNNLTFTLKSQRRSDEANSLKEKCVQLGKQVLSPQHPHIRSSLEALNEWRMENLEIEL
ncbi:kinesin light chain, partial [Lepidopterella palustris CBS 459.81]